MRNTVNGVSLAPGEAERTAGTLELHLPLADGVHLHGVEVGQVVVLVLDGVLAEREGGEAARRVAPRKHPVRSACSRERTSADMTPRATRRPLLSRSRPSSHEAMGREMHASPLTSHKHRRAARSKDPQPWQLFAPELEGTFADHIIRARFTGRNSQAIEHNSSLQPEGQVLLCLLCFSPRIVSPDLDNTLVDNEQFRAISVGWHLI